MNISNGHNGAQGHTLPEKHNSGAFAYGLSEDGFGKLTRARKPATCCSFSFLNTRLRAERWMQAVRRVSPR
jgi:hypothetical protein